MFSLQTGGTYDAERLVILSCNVGFLGYSLLLHQDSGERTRSNCRGLCPHCHRGCGAVASSNPTTRPETGQQQIARCCSAFLDTEGPAISLHRLWRAAYCMIACQLAHCC